MDVVRSMRFGCLFFVVLLSAGCEDSELNLAEGGIGGTGISVAETDRVHGSGGVAAAGGGNKDGNQSPVISDTNQSGGSEEAHLAESVPAVTANTSLSSGPINGFGSIFVNGVRFDVDQAEIYVDGERSTEDALALGMVVTVEGEINSDGLSGRAERVEFQYDLESEVLSVSEADGVIEAVGQTILVDELTIFDEATISAIQPDGEIFVSGLMTANGELLARYIRYKSPEQSGGGIGVFTSSWGTGDFGIQAQGIPSPTPDPGVGVVFEGVVEKNIAQSRLLVIGDVWINYVSARFSGLAAEQIEQGLMLRVSGVFVNGILVADQIEKILPITTSVEVGKVLFSGIVSSMESERGFLMQGGEVVQLMADTQFINGREEDLAINAKLNVVGIGSPGGVIQASHIEFKLPSIVNIAMGVDAVGEGWLTVAGINIVVDSATLMVDSTTAALRRFSLSDIGVSDRVVVHGYQVGDYVYATRLDRQDQLAGYSIQSAISSVSQNKYIEMLGVTIDTSSAGTNGFKGINGDVLTREAFFGLLETGGAVKAVGTMNGSVFVASQLRLID